jgi:hypothetical protein
MPTTATTKRSHDSEVKRDYKPEVEQLLNIVNDLLTQLKESRCCVAGPPRYDEPPKDGTEFLGCWRGDLYLASWDDKQIRLPNVNSASALWWDGYDNGFFSFDNPDWWAELHPPEPK